MCAAPALRTARQRPFAGRLGALCRWPALYGPQIKFGATGPGGGCGGGRRLAVSGALAARYPRRSAGMTEVGARVRRILGAGVADPGRGCGGS